MNLPAFAESEVFHIANHPEEDTFASTGQYDSNGFDNSYGWQYFGYSPNTASNYSAYWRWALDIPKGSTISRAYVRIHSAYNNSGPLNAAFKALVPDDKWETAAGFSTASYPNGTALESIPRQGTPVEWNNIVNWVNGTWYEGPDITDLVQARVDNVDYDPQDIEDRYFGLVLYHVSESGYRTGSQEPADDSLTAELYVEWIPSPDPPPTASAIFHIANANQEDAFAGTGRFEANGFDDPNGWQFFGYSPNTLTSYNAYWRWALTIPQGSTIMKACVRIRSDYTNSGQLNAAFKALVPDSKWETADGFSTTNYANGNALDSIPRQGTAVEWNNISDWRNGLLYESPDISELVQARIDNTDYDPESIGNEYFGLVLYYVSGTGYRTGTQEPDDDTLTAELFVRWMPPEEPNECPVASAGPDCGAGVGDTIILDGSLSEDPEADALNFEWSLDSKPLGSAAMLDDPASPMPALTVDKSGDYVAVLVVNDGICESEPDACTVTGYVVEYVCPKGVGFWKNHADMWPVDTLLLGDQTYSKSELLRLLRMPTRGDASRILTRQLIAAKLNLAYGSDPAPITDTISSADSLLSEPPGPLPSYNGRHTPHWKKRHGPTHWRGRHSSPDWKAMIQDAKTLDDYNDGLLTPDCDHD